MIRAKYDFDRLIEAVDNAPNYAPPFAHDNDHELSDEGDRNLMVDVAAFAPIEFGVDLGPGSLRRAHGPARVPFVFERVVPPEELVYATAEEAAVATAARPPTATMVVRRSRLAGSRARFAPKHERAFASGISATQGRRMLRTMEREGRRRAAAAAVSEGAQRAAEAERQQKADADAAAREENELRARLRGLAGRLDERRSFAAMQTVDAPQHRSSSQTPGLDSEGVANHYIMSSVKLALHEALQNADELQRSSCTKTVDCPCCKPLASSSPRRVAWTSPGRASSPALEAAAGRTVVEVHNYSPVRARGGSVAAEEKPPHCEVQTPSITQRRSSPPRRAATSMDFSSGLSGISVVRRTQLRGAAPRSTPVQL